MDVNEIIFKGLTVQGVYGRKMYETWYKMAAMIEGGLDLTPIITSPASTTPNLKRALPP